MNTREQALFQQETGGQADYVLRTGTSIDVGLWWLKRPLWLCVLKSELLLFAVGRRRFSERIALSACEHFDYNPSSGELVIEPADLLRFPRLKMPASEAVKLLSILKQHSTHNHQTP